MPSSLSNRSKSKSKSKSLSQQNSNSTNNTNLNLSIANTTTENNIATINQAENNSTNTVTLVNAHILQPTDASTQIQQGHIDADQLPPGSTITLAIQTISAPDSDDSLGPSMSSAACQTALSLPPLL